MICFDYVIYLWAKISIFLKKIYSIEYFCQTLRCLEMMSNAVLSVLIFSQLKIDISSQLKLKLRRNWSNEIVKINDQISKYPNTVTVNYELMSLKNT